MNRSGEFGHRACGDGFGPGRPVPSWSFGIELGVGMRRWQGAALAAGSAALVGLPAGVAAAARGPSQTDGPPQGSHCAVWAPTRAEACFSTFAESLRWVGFAGVADDVTLESFFATSPAARPAARGSLSDQRRAMDAPPGYAYGALKAGTASRVYWGPSSSCPSTWDSLVFDSMWNNQATTVVNGVCGSIRCSTRGARRIRSRVTHRPGWPPPSGDGTPRPS